MPIDIQVACPQELVRVSQAVEAVGVPLRSLFIYGDDFRSAEEVLMNEVPSPSFVILTKTKILAEVPDPLKQSTITSISVLSNKLTSTARSFIRFRLGERAGKTRGILRLMQLFLKILFTTPGTDIFAPKIGGNALAHLGQSVGAEEGADVVAGLIVSVDTTAKQVVQIQGRNQAIPPDERLLAAKVLSAGFNKNETALVASIELTSQAGTSAVARLET